MEEIIEFLHKKYDLPKGAIRAIVDSVFRCTADEMRADKRTSFGYMHLGKIVWNQRHWDKIQEKRANKKKLDEQNQRDSNRVQESSN